MKQVLYNKVTGEFDLEHEDVRYYSSRDWAPCVVYNKEDMQALGKPNSRYIPQFYLTPDGQLHQLHPSFKFISDKDRERSSKEPWFGKVCVFADGTFYDIEEDKALFKEDTAEFESFVPCDKEHYIAFHHDWSSFDEIGAYSESYHALKSQGKTLCKARDITPHFENGQLVSIKVDRENNYSLTQLELRQTLKETVEKLVDLGESSEKIGAIVSRSIKDTKKGDAERSL